VYPLFLFGEIQLVKQFRSEGSGVGRERGQARSKRGGGSSIVTLEDGTGLNWIGLTDAFRLWNG
jgi:hypothetical protein